MTDDRGEEGFLKRWSRLKRESEKDTGPREIVPAQVHDAASPSATKTAHLDPSKTDDAANAPDAEEENRPAETQDFSKFDFDSLNADSDYTRFMKDDVSSDVRSKALQKLWLTDPQFAHIDGLLEYAEDYTDAAVVPVGAVATAYRVGKGFLSDKEVKEWDELGKPPEEEEKSDDEIAAAAGLEKDNAKDAGQVSEVDAEEAHTELASDAIEDDDQSPVRDGDARSNFVSVENREDDDGPENA